MNNELVRKSISAVRRLMCAFFVFAIAGGGFGFTERGPVFHIQPPVSAEPGTITPEDIRALLTDPEILMNGIRQLGVPASQESIYLDHLMTLWSTEVVIDAFLIDIAPVFETADQSKPESFYFIAENFSSIWFQENALLGMNRLPIEDVRFFLGLSRTLVLSIPDQECAALARNELSASEMARLEVRGLEGVSDSRMEGYLRIMRKGLLAELRNNPSPKTLGPSELMVVEQVLGERVIDIINQQPNADRLMDGFTNLNYLTDSEACQFNLLMLDVLLNEEGKVGDWLLRYSLS